MPKGEYEGIVAVSSMGWMMKDLVQKLEHAVLDLGTEVYLLKGQVKELAKENHDMKAALQALQRLLDEKGLLDADELDLNVGKRPETAFSIHDEEDFVDHYTDPKKATH